MRANSPSWAVTSLCKDFSDYISSLFLIVKFAVDASYSHINLIIISAVMRDLLGVFYDIINVYLALLRNGYNLPV